MLKVFPVESPVYASSSNMLGWQTTRKRSKQHKFINLDARQSSLEEIHSEEN